MKYTIWQLLKNILDAVNNDVHIRDWLGKPCNIFLISSAWFSTPPLSTDDAIRFQTPVKNDDEAARSSVENHAEEIKNYYDGNEISEWCDITSCTWSKKCLHSKVTWKILYATNSHNVVIKLQLTNIEIKSKVYYVFHVNV